MRGKGRDSSPRPQIEIGVFKEEKEAQMAGDMQLLKRWEGC